MVAGGTYINDYRYIGRTALGYHDNGESRTVYRDADFSAYDKYPLFFYGGIIVAKGRRQIQRDIQMAARLLYNR